MTKISVIGICGNSTFMTLDHFHERGETAVADSVFSEIGGKGINQAIAAARMGAEVSFLAAVGDDDDGEKCAECAKQNGISAFLKVKKDASTAMAFILTDKSGDNRVTVYRGASLDVCDVDSFEKEIAESDILLLQNEVSDEVNIRALEIAVRHGVRTILNPAPARKIPDFIAKNVYLITPNEQEMKSLDISLFKNVVITLGGDGCLVNGKTKIPAVSANPVDTTGAGDTFNGTLAVCLAEGMDLEKASQYANAAAGLSVEKKYVLPSIPKRNEIERKLNYE